MTARVQRGGLQVARVIAELLEKDIVPGTAIAPEVFWQGLETLVEELAPVNRALLEKRHQLQQQIDRWHQERRGQPHDPVAYRRFLTRIGYLAGEPEDFTISTQGVDPEIALLAGPQLVVPVSNARFALNAANARWGSLYDALYGSDVIAFDNQTPTDPGYNPQRGQQVIAFARAFLDEALPLAQGSHAQACHYAIRAQQLVITRLDGSVTGLAQPQQLAGYRGSEQAPESILLKNNGLHIDLQIDRQSAIGQSDPAGIRDVVLESALTTIMDCEDSVAAVDAADKVLVYGNWLGLMKGTLAARFAKNGQPLVRTMNPDRHYLTPAGQPLTLPGRSLMLIRNVGLLMTSDAILDAQGQDIPEGIMDALFSACIALHDLNKNPHAAAGLSNSPAGSVYIVKPKLHGPEEVAFSCRLFERVEALLGLACNTLKIGVMDEERRTSVNLKACIHAARERIIFINTGFLDRTGDEIHTSQNAGLMVPRAAMKQARWLQAYEDQNVALGLATGMKGRAQIGKGMWPMPDEMAQMLASKIDHPRAGASTAWVPSPTAATLHALHYHRVNVAQRQDALAGRRQDAMAALLSLPLLEEQLDSQTIQQELDNAVQGILGYVVRWVEQGIGCSKVPDINHTGLMEDRATLRIASQHIANWLHHGICTRDQVMATLQRMAGIVDQQNAGDSRYLNMAPGFNQSLAFQASCDLIFQGLTLPNGYTEPVLHARRRQFKAQASASPVDQEKARPEHAARVQ